MAPFFQCHSCSKITPLFDGNEKKCPLCGGTNGDIRTLEQVNEMREAGAAWNIDPKTGKRAKKKR